MYRLFPNSKKGGSSAFRLSMLEKISVRYYVCNLSGKPLDVFVGFYVESLGSVGHSEMVGLSQYGLWGKWDD